MDIAIPTPIKKIDAVCKVNQKDNYNLVLKRLSKEQNNFNN